MTETAQASLASCILRVIRCACKLNGPRNVSHHCFNYSSHQNCYYWVGSSLLQKRETDSACTVTIGAPITIPS
jgi:hypothetical protein